MASEYKKYTLQAQTAIRGEAFFEMLLSSYAIPHHITGHKDIGVDYLCEWTFGDRPTGVLFTAQVKTFDGKHGRFEKCDRLPKHNNLDRYNISYSHLRIDDRTIAYWRGLGMPAYLFAIAVSSDLSETECYYKRYTEYLTKTCEREENFHTLNFFHVNNGTSFLAFANQEKRTLGFARDLFIDHVRCAYSKGMIAFPDPKKMGLNQFSWNTFFSRDLYPEYRDQLHDMFDRYKQCLGHRERESPKP